MASRIGRRHARKHLGWALDAAAATAGAPVALLKDHRARVLTAEEPRDGAPRCSADAYDAFARGGPPHERARKPLSDRARDSRPMRCSTRLPHPVIMVAPDGKIADANVAAEQFFEASIPMLRRHLLRDLVPFGSPLLALVEQVRQRGAAVNEYKVDLAHAAQSAASGWSTCMSRRCRNIPATSW